MAGGEAVVLSRHSRRLLHDMGRSICSMDKNFIERRGSSLAPDRRNVIVYYIRYDWVAYLGLAMGYFVTTVARSAYSRLILR